MYIYTPFYTCAYTDHMLNLLWSQSTLWQGNAQPVTPARKRSTFPKPQRRCHNYV